MVSGQWSVVSGQWSVVSGQWSVVSCQLSVVSCQCQLSVEEQFRLVDVNPGVRAFSVSNIGSGVRFCLSTDH